MGTHASANPVERLGGKACLHRLVARRQEESVPTHGAASQDSRVNTAPSALSDVTLGAGVRLGFSCRSCKVLELPAVVENIRGAVCTPTCVRTGCCWNHSNAGDGPQRLCHQRGLTPTGCPDRSRLSWGPGRRSEGWQAGGTPVLLSSLPRGFFICTVFIFHSQLTPTSLLAPGEHRSH